MYLYVLGVHSSADFETNTVWVAIKAHLLKRWVLRAGLKLLNVVSGVVEKGCLRVGVLLFLSLSALFPTLVRSQEYKILR